MYVRLAFAVAAHLDPEVLLLDEVLAVGDSAFQQKCLHRIDELTQSGRTVLFVSHTPSAVAQLCHRVVVVNGGKVVFDGDVDQGIQEYLGSPQIDGGASALEQEAQLRDGSGEVRVTAVRVLGADGGRIVPDKPVTFEVDLVAAKRGKRARSRAQPRDLECGERPARHAFDRVRTDRADSRPGGGRNEHRPVRDRGAAAAAVSLHRQRQRRASWCRARFVPPPGGVHAPLGRLLQHRRDPTRDACLDGAGAAALAGDRRRPPARAAVR